MARYPSPTRSPRPHHSPGIKPGIAGTGDGKGKGDDTRAPSPTRIRTPDRCPHCNSPKVSVRGTRTKKLETVPRMHCKACGRNFTPGPRLMRHKTFPLPEILDAIGTYNRGYGHAATPSTISRWASQYPELTTYARLRTEGRTLASPARTLLTSKLYHRQVYEFSAHRPKLAMLKAGRLDTGEMATEAVATLAAFLEAVPTICPHELFTDESGAAARGSQLGETFLELDRLMVTERRNAATDTAALIIPSVGSNHQRHSHLQRFMLTNDAATIAVEVPIWLDEADIAALEDAHGITLMPKRPVHPGRPHEAHWPRRITGHIDFLQVRSGSLHILDYKPDARTNRPVAQLTIYALALNRLVPGLRLFDIKCAWFNETAYNEFFPRKLLPPPRVRRCDR